MKKVIFTGFVLMSFVALARAQVDFDRGVNLKETISKARNSELAVPEARFGSRYTRDCARFSFGPDAGDITSDKVWLHSMEYVQECNTVMQPGPNGTPVPVQSCYERPGMSWNQTAQIKMAARKLWPWERESFDVCLDGPWMDLYVNEAGYKYSVNRAGDYDTLFTLAPLQKVALDPDANGLNMGAFYYVKGLYTFGVNDSWAKEYAWEKVVIHIELFKDNPFWFDSSQGSKDFTFDTREGYTMYFSVKDLESKGPAEPADTRGASKFYLKWSFKRVGAISADTFMKKDQTPSIEAE